MAIKLSAVEAYTVYAALDDMIADRRRGIRSKHTYGLTEEEYLKLQARYLRAWLTLERIEGGKDE